MKIITPFIYIILLLLILCLIPIVYWHLAPAKAMNILIVDKTVPDRTFHEHKGIMWLLNHLKYLDLPDRTHFKYDRDYAGFCPQKNDTFQIRPMSYQPSMPDFIYLADIYGVFSDDFYRDDANSRNRIRLLYGGLNKNDLRVITNTLENGGALIAETNSFAYPSNYQDQQVMINILGLKWSGWSGRYFPNLEAGVEVPDWILREYQKQYSTNWNFNSPGFVFYDESRRLFVLPHKNKDPEESVNISFSPANAHRFQVAPEVKFYNWFEIILPDSSTEVLANFKLNLTPENRFRLNKMGLPDAFPAIVKNSRYQQGVYYLAGDFADMKVLPPIWSFKGCDFIFVNLFRNQNNETYWRVYLPFMKAVLEDIYQSRSAVKR